MLFDISTGAPIPVPTWAEELMKQDFPEFFAGQSIKIKVTPSRMLRVQKVSSSDKSSEPRNVLESPPGNTRKARGIVIDPMDGEPFPIQFSSSYPRVQNGKNEWGYPSGYITIQDGMTILPNQIDLLFYLHFLCPNIKDNRCINRTSDPFYEYDRPEMDAKTKMDTAKKAREFESLIYFDTPYDLILKAINGLGMVDYNSEERNRVALHDAIKSGNEVFKKNAFEILGSQAKKVEAKADESVHELVNRLLSENFIKNEDGMWYIRDRRGDGTKWLKNPFFESKQEGAEGTFELIDHLKVNSELLDKLRKL